MPFVSDIVGPQQPVRGWPPLAVGVLRRTSTIDTHPDGDSDSDVDLRARDAVGTEDGAGVFAEVRLRAHLAARVIDRIDGAPLDALLGRRVGPGFRSALGELLPDEVRRSSLVNLLLDDWVGAALVSGYALAHKAIIDGVEQKLPPGTTDRMLGICAGFAPGASMDHKMRELGTIPSVHGPIAPLLDGLHELEPLGAHGMRRLRRLDLDPESGRFDAHFRDSHVDGDGVETIVHEYTVEGQVDVPARRIAAITAHARVLPWQECPNALGSAHRLVGMTLGEVRDRVRGEFVGTSTCTHLNDTLRVVGDLGALLELRAR